MDWQISREVEENKISWMSGIWDGEGCIRAFFSKNRINQKPNLCVEAFVKNSDVLMIKKISHILYDSKIKFCFFLSKPRRDKNGICHKPMISIKVAGKGNVWKLLTLMFPHLSTKKKQAYLVLQLIEYRESLGYHGTAKCNGCGNQKASWNGKLITDDIKIRQLVDQIKFEKDNLIDPSETKRVANRPLEIPEKTMMAYLMI